MNVKTFLAAVAVCAVFGGGLQARADDGRRTGAPDADHGDRGEGDRGEHRDRGRGDHRRGEHPYPNPRGMVVCYAQSNTTGVSYAGTGYGVINAQNSAVSACTTVTGDACVVTGCD